MMFCPLCLLVLFQLTFGKIVCQHYQQNDPFNIDTNFTIIVDPLIKPSNMPYYTPLFSSLVATSHKNTHKIYIGSPNYHSNDSFIAGAVFQCHFSLTGSNCNPIRINEDVFIFGTQFQYRPSNKSLFGMTLLTTDEALVTCAPNWVGQKETPEGICFALDKFSLGQRVIFKYPLEVPVKSNRPYESHNLFGIAMTYNRKNNDVLFGLPGFKDFTGALCRVNDDLITTKIPLERFKSSTNTYTGYSVAYFPLNGDDAILASTPKFNIFKGKVELIDINTQQVMQTLYSKNDTIAEFFGSTLLVVDIENDDNSEVLVGAPYYSPSPKQREIGRVYIFRDIKRSLTNNGYNFDIILSPNKKPGSRFGSNLAIINLNLDRFNDVIISAPFEPNDDRTSFGAIYIYYGSKQGLNIADVKRIDAQSISQRNIYGFGFILWTETDFDGNGYQDLAIGSLTTNKAFILRTYPIIRINVTMNFEPKGINFTDTRQCSNQNPCFRVGYCLHLDSPLFEFQKHELTFNVQLTVPDRFLDLKEERVINGKQNKTVKTKSNRFCSERQNSFYVELKKKEDIFDIITPIEIQLSVNLQNDHEKKQFCPNCPVANFLTTFQEIGFEHGCAHQYCLSKLILNADIKYGSMQTDGMIVEGQYNSLDIIALITNLGESSINTQMIIHIEPNQLNLIPSSDSAKCSALNTENGFKCEINKLMITNQKEELILRLDTGYIESKFLSLNFELKTSSQIDEGSQLKFAKNLTIRKEAQFSMRMQLENHYNYSNFVPKVLFPVSVVIEKSGPSNIDGAYIQFEVPWMIEMEQPFQYRCTKIKRGSEIASNFDLINETLQMTCDGHSAGCSRYQCKMNNFQTGNRLKNFDITLAFISGRIKSRIIYKEAFLNTLFQLITNDTFFDREQSFAETRPSFTFYKMNSEEAKSKNLIMFGGAGLGILIIILTTIILIKYGFFKRKKLEKLKQVKQRMSMNPNMFPIPVMDSDVNEINQIGSQE